MIKKKSSMKEGSFKRGEQFVREKHFKESINTRGTFLKSRTILRDEKFM